VKTVNVLEQRLQAAFEQAAVGMAHAYPSGRFCCVNQKLCDILGYTREELCERTFHEITHPDDVPRSQANVDRLVAGDIDGYTIEKRGVRKDGSPIWIKVTVSAVRDSDGTLRYLAGVVADLTERKQAEEQITWLASVVHSSEDAILSVTFDGYVVRSWNAAAERLFGYTSGEAIGRSISALIVPPERAHEPPMTLERLKRGERIRKFETVWTHKSGRRINVELMLSPVSDDSGNIIGASGVVRDVTDRVEAQARLRESEERMRLILIATTDAIWDHDLVHNTVWWSDSYRALFGYEPVPESKRLQWWVDHIHPQDRERVAHGFVTALAGESDTWHEEYQYQRVDGTWAFVEDRGNIVRDAHGAAMRVLGAMHDVTDRVEAQAKLREADRLAAIGNLAAGLAHDMTNILLPMRSRLALLRTISVPEETSESFDVVERCAASLDNLVKGIRRLVRSGVDTAPRPVHPASWWATTRDLLRAAMQRGVELVGEFGDDLPPFYANEDLLTRAMLNLVVNASEAITEASPSGGRVVVWSRCEECVEDVLLGVRDDGPGMTPEVQQRLFEPFFSTKKAGLSTGMGMSVVKAFASTLGGTITVESKPGCGTNVTLRLPARRCAQSAQQLVSGNMNA
jgi:PAS domain S-box-containing protein